MPILWRVWNGTVRSNESKARRIMIVGRLRTPFQVAGERWKSDRCNLDLSEIWFLLLVDVKLANLYQTAPNFQDLTVGNRWNWIGFPMIITKNFCSLLENEHTRWLPVRQQNVLFVPKAEDQDITGFDELEGIRWVRPFSFNHWSNFRPYFQFTLGDLSGTFKCLAVNNVGVTALARWQTAPRSI